MVGCVFLRSIVLATSTGDDPPLVRTDVVGGEAPGGRRAAAGPVIGRCETCDGGMGRGRARRVDSLAFAELWGVIPAPVDGVRWRIGRNPTRPTRALMWCLSLRLTCVDDGIGPGGKRWSGLRWSGVRVRRVRLCLVKSENFRRYQCGGGDIGYRMATDPTWSVSRGACSPERPTSLHRIRDRKVTHV